MFEFEIGFLQDDEYHIHAEELIRSFKKEGTIEEGADQAAEDAHNVPNRAINLVKN
jgi:hypothetical protein